MNDQRLADSFRGLSDATRLQLIRTLMEACGPMGQSSGLSAGELCAKVTGAAKINSTISHHLKELRQAGLVEVRRTGRSMIFRPRTEGFREMVSFLLDVE